MDELHRSSQRTDHAGRANPNDEPVEAPAHEDYAEVIALGLCWRLESVPKVPSRFQRRNSLYTVSHWPYRSGMSRHGASSEPTQSSVRLGEAVLCSRRSGRP